MGENFSSDEDGNGADTVRGDRIAFVREKLFEKTDDK